MSADMGWRLGLDAIIINDGNYGDFARGQRIEVALECDLWEPATPTECEPSATFSGQSRWSAVDYAICAEVIHRYDRTGEVVLDCGLLRSSRRAVAGR